MNNKNSTAIYRTLLREAWRLTWQRKTLWIFGIFAAFVSTGGVLDVATSGFKRVTTGGAVWQHIAEMNFSKYVLFGQYVSQAHLFGNFRVQAALLCTFLVLIGMLFLAVLSQTALIHGIKAPAHEHPNTLRKRAHDHLFRVFIIDLLTKFVTAILMVITTFPVLWNYLLTHTYSLSFALLHVLLFFPSIIIVSILSMLSIIHLIETGCSVAEAIGFAWNTFKQHWIATFEYGVVLFLLVALGCFGLLALMIVLSVPYGLIYTASLLTGSIVIFVLANVLYGLFALVVALAAGGALVTFQYSAWYLFYKRAEFRPHLSHPISKLLRWMKGTT